MAKDNLSRKQITAIVIAIILLWLISLLAQFNDSADLGDYAGVAKFFAGEYNAKIRSSHSLFWGLIHSPLVWAIGGFIGLKIMNLIYLSLIVASVYYASGKDKRALFLFIVSPILWYMGPWINPIQIASLFFFWGYYFLRKWEMTGRNSLLVVSGMLVGLSWAFWDAVIYFAIIITFSFFYNKRAYHLAEFVALIFIGLSPKLISDYLIYNSPIIGILRYVSSTIVTMLWGGINGKIVIGGKSLIKIISVLLMVPFFSYLLIKKEKWNKDKKSLIFIIFAFLLILINSQPRYFLLLAPILILNLAPELNKSQFKAQMIIYLIISAIVISPYLIQFNYSTNGSDIIGLFENIGNLSIKDNQNAIILNDLDSMAKEFPNEVFVVGNTADTYKELALIYWGKGIKEFVSLEDYGLYLKNDSTIFSKTYEPLPNIADRRAIWISGGIKKNPLDKTDYHLIRFAISKEPEIDLEGFELKKEYSLLSVFEKVN